MNVYIIVAGHRPYAILARGMLPQLLIGATQIDISSTLRRCVTRQGQQAGKWGRIYPSSTDADHVKFQSRCLACRWQHSYTNDVSHACAVSDSSQDLFDDFLAEI